MTRPAAAGRGVPRGTIIERVGDDALAPLAAGDFRYVGHDEPTADGRIVAVRAHGPGSATLVRLIAVESGRSVLRAANPAGPTWR